VDEIAILAPMAEPQSSNDRIALNEALFRQVNERVKDVSEASWALESNPTGFVCECGLRDCTERVRMRLSEYEAVRAQPTTFFVMPDHVIPEVERVVADHGLYVVVEKFPEEADVARETDPRS
jgi:hypothetical protein